MGTTLRELIYSITDRAKLLSDDIYLTEDYVAFLIKNVRSTLLQKKYEQQLTEPHNDNFQTICLDLERVNLDSGNPCGMVYLRSVNPIPSVLTVYSPKVMLLDMFKDLNPTLVSEERFKFVGYNKWLGNIIYCTIGEDNRLYFKSANPQHFYLQKVKLKAIFDDYEEAFNMSCKEECCECECDIYERPFPIEPELVSILIDTVFQNVASMVYNPEDIANNTKDDLAGLNVKTAKDTKQNLADLLG